MTTDPSDQARRFMLPLFAAPLLAWLLRLTTATFPPLVRI